ncbi:hypothetical protein [Mycoplasma suis]|uniref:Uncharacterized protein n=2 Tax=Mycoplasma suis TaxID=57372 RepID=F0QRE3_MYCSL|nr:hypothetical protein [Mycoplasma suis]ADX98063.1 hypothetical protein MSU_0529 [Mycoplasma suis str. Illinois]
MGGGGSSGPHNDLSRIFKVSEETKESTQSKKPILRAEFYLKNMDRESYWKYCVVNEGKNLFKKSQQEVSAVTTSTSASNSTTEECKWKYLYEIEEKDYDSELIRELLKKMYQFWRVEHVFNMLALYQKDSKISTEGSGSGTNGDIKITWEENNQTLTTTSAQQENSFLKKIKDNCDLKTEQTKDSLDVLFLSPDLKKKSCLPSPVLTNITLKLGSQNNVVAAAASQPSPKSTNNFLNKEKISGGTFSGTLGYSLFDYWTNLKRTKENNGSRLPIILFESKNEYSLKEDSQGSSDPESSSTQKPFSLKKFFDSVDQRTLELKNFVKEQKSLSLKLKEISPNQEDLIY